MTDELSQEERGLLAIFRALGAGTDVAVPERVLEYRYRQAGFLVAGSRFETALLNLEFRGLARPGEGALNARSWLLTKDGAAALHGG